MSRARQMSVLALISTLGVAATPLHAGAKNGAIRVLAVDFATRQSLAGATVDIVEMGRSAATDASGRVTFEGVPVGSYTLGVRHDGHRSQSTSDVIVKSGQVSAVVVELWRDDARPPRRAPRQTGYSVARSR
jgi:hypothetical protein